MRWFGLSITGASSLLRGCPGDAPSLPDFPSSVERSLFQKFPEAGPGLGRAKGQVEVPPPHCRHEINNQVRKVLAKWEVVQVLCLLQASVFPSV